MRKISLLLLLLVVPTSVFAQYRDRGRYYPRYDSRFELTPFAGYTWGGTIFSDTTSIFKQDVQAATSANLGVDFAIPLGITHTKLDLMVNRQDTNLTTGGGGLFEPDNRVANLHVTYYHAGLMIPFAESRNATPFVVVSAGVANLAPDVSGASSSNRFSASAGIGVKVPVSDNFGIRLEGRGYFTSLTNGSNNCFHCGDTNGRDFYQGQVNLGFIFFF
jgi:hypothetical protein